MGTTQAPSAIRRFLDASDRAGLWIVGVGAALVALTHTVSMVISAQRIFGHDPLAVEGIPFSDDSVPEFTEHLPAITEARYEAVTAVVEGVPSAARWLLWGAEATGSLAAIGVCLALIWLCVRVARQRPFGRSATVALLITAALVMVGGVLPQMLATMGRAEVVDHLGVAEMLAEQGRGMVMSFSLELSLAPIGIGLALGVVAAAFEIGERLQRDTQGLV